MKAVVCNRRDGTKRQKPEEIVSKLQQVEILVGQGAARGPTRASGGDSDGRWCRDAAQGTNALRRRQSPGIDFWLSSEPR